MLATQRPVIDVLLGKQLFVSGAVTDTNVEWRRLIGLVIGRPTPCTPITTLANDGAYMFVASQMSNRLALGSAEHMHALWKLERIWPTRRCVGIATEPVHRDVVFVPRLELFQKERNRAGLERLRVKHVAG